MFSDYISWLIYYPSMLFYLICFGLLLVFDILILLPTLIFMGFVVGYLFSLLGDPNTESKGTLSMMKGMLNKGMSMMKNPSMLKGSLQPEVK